MLELEKEHRGLILEAMKIYFNAQLIRLIENRQGIKISRID